MALSAGLVFALPMTACEGDDANFVIPEFNPDSGTFQVPDTGTTAPPDSATDEPDATPDTPDADAPAACDDGKVDPGETCDPLASCPTDCAPAGCQLRELQNAGTCKAACVDTKLQDACINGDGCCPPSCNANNDDDCKPGCGNGIVEAGETCDPLTTCPQACPQLGCQLRTLKNPGTCTAECVNAGMQTQCVNGDGCCPAGCNANNDNDCKPACGNGVVEKGETCDPLTSCPQTCPQIGCNLQALVGGGTCQAACTAAGQQEKCVSNDGCCPKGCNANNDNDCKAVCGNNVVEPGETCDPSTSCVTKCETETYSCFTATGAAKTCDFACHQPSTCGTLEEKVKQPACCPYGKGGSCGAKQDSDCAGDGWKFVAWPTAVSTDKGCTTLVLQDMVPGGSYEITTCGPADKTPGDGDTSIGNVIDNTQTTYAVGNDDCTDAAALPRLAGWVCKNKLGEKLSCASPSPGGFIFNKSAKATTLSFQVCGTGQSPGKTPVYIWYNAPKAPTPAILK